MPPMRPARIGTAGWSIASQYADAFPAVGMGLERYAARLPCVEINSSFYRAHRASTWTRWGELVSADFRFSVKVPRAVTHERRLRDCSDLIARLLDESAGLGEKLAVLLVQLPPTLRYEPDVAEAFFATTAAATSARVACEPRHPSWFEPAADRLLAHLRIARVAADPARVPAAAEPGGWRGLPYWRLHGSPEMYRSSYEPTQLDYYAERIASDRQATEPAWCIFDNTASFAALGNALDLSGRLSASSD